MSIYEDEYVVCKEDNAMTIYEDEYVVDIECKLDLLKKRVKGFIKEENKSCIRFISNDFTFIFKNNMSGYLLGVFDKKNDVYLKSLDFPYFWRDKFFRH